MSSARGIPVDNVETYLGYAELDAYLKDRLNPSYSGFLRRHREVVVASSLAEVGTTSWKALDITWFRRFSQKATLENELLEKINKERSGMENYWKDVEVECKLRRERNHLNALIEVVAQRWEYNLDEEDEDDAHDPPAPIEEAEPSNIDSPHLIDFQEEEEISDIDNETPELTEGVRQLNISRPEPIRVQAVWRRQRLSAATMSDIRTLRPVKRVAYTGLSNRCHTSKKRQREPVPERSTSHPPNSPERSRQSDVDFGHDETVDLGDENVEFGNVEVDSVHSSGASDDGDNERPRKRPRCLGVPSIA
ncbi:hypothetical protein RclHR1_06410004 [Rhizophagus clarus]|uniref:Uncharacterized protein n=1 Tax=Rhizophagus clarus TaxID=94130 RepID=A0A2Z6SID8_9GLOM|nr:hypothetical protein RclHR1_06410004 [Rhizophagus clarus]